LTANTYYGIDVSNSQYVNIEGNNIAANTLCGINFVSSNDSIIRENKITNNAYHGIWLTWGSTNNSISGNSLIANNSTGIYFLQSSNSNRMSGNNVTANNQYGICFGYSSSNNSIEGNDITYNQYAAEFWASSNNMVYHNNFINNLSGQAYIYNSTNQWDNGYPSGGNYWSDYNGTDVFKGAYQNVTGSDGIGDTPCSIDASNKDNYPLMGSFGASTSTGSNVTVFPTTDVSVTFDNVTAAGLTTAERVESGPPPPSNFTSIGQYYEITVTAQYSDNITVRIIYDDLNLTQQEEDSLRLFQWWPEVCDVTSNVTGVPDDIDNMRDIGYFANRFMTNSSSTNWDLRCDVTGPTPNVPDGVVNMRDIGMAANHFGCHGQWANITLFIDTANNLIFGETTHFSLIGIHKGE
jgi:parallel beta-helix repeat protein